MTKIVLNGAGTAVNNNLSGPDGVVSHGRWLYAGDGDSTLKVIDLEAPQANALKQVIPTGGTTRVDEMTVNENGRLLLLETSSLPSYDLTRRFYVKHGYYTAATVKDFYADGHDKVIYGKRLAP